MLKTAVKSAFTNGGNPTVLMTTPTQKVNVSAFTGVAAQRYMATGDKPTTIIGAADIYLSDFGTLSVVPNRFMTADSGDSGEQAFVLDPEYAAVAYLRPFQTNELAKSGDAHTDKHTRWGDDIFDNKIASIPMTVFDELNKRGIVRGFHVIDQKAFRKFLNDPDNKVFRTREGTV